MRYRWPEDTQFTRVVLNVEQEVCSLWQRHLHVCDHRFHPILSLQGPLQLVCKLAHCPVQACPAHRHTLSLGCPVCALFVHYTSRRNRVPPTRGFRAEVQ
jgi:hypothetical protein